MARQKIQDEPVANICTRQDRQTQSLDCASSKGCSKGKCLVGQRTRDRVDRRPGKMATTSSETFSNT